jgi:hypothetical protein
MFEFGFERQTQRYVTRYILDVDVVTEKIEQASDPKKRKLPKK